ncbi:hypothetical protein ATE84_0247 [Aquimarina sp. MAR_2010_214]|nr:hypothetical protein ATE84_0247 [Aquimarina sp. MAR_2010_214]
MELSFISFKFEVILKIIEIVGLKKQQLHADINRKRLSQVAIKQKQPRNCKTLASQQKQGLNND